MRKKLALTVLVLGIITLTTAHHAHAKDHSKMGKGDMSLENKLMKKLHCIFMMQDELGMTEEQLNKIKELKLKTKKDLIKKKAEIDILAVDIKAQFWGNTLDATKTKDLISKKYDLKKEKASIVVDGYVALQNILTDSQKKKMKDLCNAKPKKNMMYEKMKR